MNDKLKFLYKRTRFLSQIGEFLILYFYHKVTDVHLICFYKSL